MRHSKTLTNIFLWVGTIGIYVASLYSAYIFFYTYSYISNIWLALGVTTILISGGCCIWFIFSMHAYYTQAKKGTPTPTNPSPPEEKKIPSPQLTQNKKDKKIQKNYQKILIEYKQNLSSHEYKKFQEDTQYDILLYDAIMVSRDKECTLLAKIQHEKGDFYADTLRKILE